MSPSTELPRRTARFAMDLARWIALGMASGVLAGLACWAFLEVLDRATDARLDHGWLVWLLPVAGLGVGLAYHRIGGRAGEGNALLLDEIHEPTAWVPRRMAPLVAAGTVVSQLFGASVGREGTALQMSGSLSDWLARVLGLGPEDRRILLTAALGGGFGAIFGVPLAGAVFGLEVQRVAWVHHLRTLGRADQRSHRWSALGVWVRLALATLVGSVIGNFVVLGLGYDHGTKPQIHVGIDAALLGRVAIVGVACGLMAILFIEATDLVRLALRPIRWAPARPTIGGVLVLCGVALVGRAYLGLSLPLISNALAGDHTSLGEPFAKLAFTVVCIGAGFVGGEVTPLFVIGTTLGAALAPMLGLDPVVGAAVGFGAVFAGATNTPAACAVMGMELFGLGATAPLLVACVVAYLCSGRRGIYATQRVTVDGAPMAVHDLPGLHLRLIPRRYRPPG